MRIRDIKKQISDTKVRAGYFLLIVFFVTGLVLINACNGGSSPSGDTPPSNNNTQDPVQDDDDNGNEGDNTSTAYIWDSLDFLHTYDVGPGKTYAEPGDVPWESLAPSSLVRIYHRNTPYQAKWVINVAATAEAPVVILGIKEGGKRPVISGNDAVTRTELDYWNEVRSVIKVGGSSIPDNPDGPSYIYIQGLDIRSSRPGYRFTDDSGTTREYSSNAAAIHIEEGSDITIHDCLIHDAGNGLFSGSASSGIMISGNHIYDNGIEGSIYEHNSYTESLGIVFEYNHYGPLRAGCLGNNLKDRSSGTIIRYNWIESGNRQLDLVETDYDHIVNAPAYDETFVYCNVLIEPDGAGNSQILHYGGDGGHTDMYRRGTLYFYHNTVVSTRSGNTTLMRLSTVDVTALVFGNIIYSSAGGRYLAITSGNGQTELENNWLPMDWQLTHESDLYPGATVADMGNTEGSTPGFIDFNAQDFHLSADSFARGNAGTLPADVATYPVEYQYVQHQSIEARSSGSVSDIGAFGY